MFIFSILHFSAGGLLIGQLDRVQFFESLPSNHYRPHILPLDGKLPSNHYSLLIGQLDRVQFFESLPRNHYRPHILPLDSKFPSNHYSLLIGH